ELVVVTGAADRARPGGLSGAADTERVEPVAPVAPVDGARRFSRTGPGAQTTLDDPLDALDPVVGGKISPSLELVRVADVADVPGDRVLGLLDTRGVVHAGLEGDPLRERQTHRVVLGIGEQHLHGPGVRGGRSRGGPVGRTYARHVPVARTHQG